MLVAVRLECWTCLGGGVWKEPGSEDTKQLNTFFERYWLLLIHSSFLKDSKLHLAFSCTPVSTGTLTGSEESKADPLLNTLLKKHLTVAHVPFMSFLLALREQKKEADQILCVLFFFSEVY